MIPQSRRTNIGPPATEAEIVVSMSGRVRKPKLMIELHTCLPIRGAVVFVNVISVPPSLSPSHS